MPQLARDKIKEKSRNNAMKGTHLERRQAFEDLKKNARHEPLQFVKGTGKERIPLST